MGIMENMEIYSKVRAVPDSARKTINAGRLKGMTDINPQWRIRVLTETFGPCGFGWKAEPVNKWLEPAPNGEIAAFCDILLYIKVDGEWSEGIPGTGGSMFVAEEKSGPHVNDEAYKMAMTDAISVAAKMLGVGADVYWATDATKYTNREEPAPAPVAKSPMLCTDCGKVIEDVTVNDKDYTAMQVMQSTSKKFGRPLCYECATKRREAE